MTLGNLLKINQLRRELPDKREFEGHFDADELLLAELISCSNKLLAIIKKIKLPE